MRIWTNRNFPNKGSYEAIDTDFESPDHWSGIPEIKVEYRWHGSETNAAGEDMIGFSFPCDVEFVTEKFKESGREFNESKLQDLKDKQRSKG